MITDKDLLADVTELAVRRLAHEFKESDLQRIVVTLCANYLYRVFDNIDESDNFLLNVCRRLQNDNHVVAKISVKDFPNKEYDEAVAQSLAELLCVYICMQKNEYDDSSIIKFVERIAYRADVLEVSKSYRENVLTVHCISEDTCDSCLPLALEVTRDAFVEYEVSVLKHTFVEIDYDLLTPKPTLQLISETIRKALLKGEDIVETCKKLYNERPSESLSVEWVRNINLAYYCVTHYRRKCRHIFRLSTDAERYKWVNQLSDKDIEACRTKDDLIRLFKRKKVQFV